MSSLSVGSRLRVVYDFPAEEAEEMTVSVGEVVHVADVSALGEGWVRVRSLAGHTGLVPVGTSSLCIYLVCLRFTKEGIYNGTRASNAAMSDSIGSRNNHGF